METIQDFWKDIMEAPIKFCKHRHEGQAQDDERPVWVNQHHRTCMHQDKEAAMKDNAAMRDLNRRGPDVYPRGSRNQTSIRQTDMGSILSRLQNKQGLFPWIHGNEEDRKRQ